MLVRRILFGVRIIPPDRSSFRFALLKQLRVRDAVEGSLQLRMNPQK